MSVWACRSRCGRRIDIRGRGHRGRRRGALQQFSYQRVAAAQEVERIRLHEGEDWADSHDHAVTDDHNVKGDRDEDAEADEHRRRYSDEMKHKADDAHYKRQQETGDHGSDFKGKDDAHISRNADSNFYEDVES